MLNRPNLQKSIFPEKKEKRREKVKHYSTTLNCTYLRRFPFRWRLPLRLAVGRILVIALGRRLTWRVAIINRLLHRRFTLFYRHLRLAYTIHRHAADVMN